MIGFILQSLRSNRARRMCPEAVRAIQERRLRRLLRVASARSPFYRELYRGIDLRNCRLEDLPTTTKAVLMEQFDRVVCDPEIRRADLERFLDQPENEGRLFLGKYIASHTSGSQGQPMLIVQHRSLSKLLFSLQVSRGNNRGISPAEIARRFADPARMAIVTLKRGFYPSAAVFEFMPREVRPFLDILWLSQTDPEVVEALNAYRPTILTAYAGVLEELALAAEGGRLRIGESLTQIVSNSEALTDRAKRRIEGAFGLHVMNNYATGECTFLSNGCPTDGGAHLNADWSILEVVDSLERPVEPGTPGSKVLVTNLANTALPFIRYEVGDVVTMATAPCRCGSLLPRVERIEGRSADTFWINAEGGGYRQLISSVFKNAFDYTREVREWRATQVDRNRFEIEVELVPGLTLDEGHLWWSLHRQLDLYRFRDLIAISLRVVPRLAADPITGKFRRIVSPIGPPADLEQRLRPDAGHPAAPDAHLAVNCVDQIASNQ